MDNNKGGLRRFNLSNYISPEIKEESTKDYVTFGKKNSYFTYLIDRYRGSTTNGACINSISDIIYGKGLDSNQKAMRPNEWAQIKSLVPEDDLKKVILDLKVTGQCAFQVQYQGGRKTIRQALHIPIESLAPEKELKDGNIQAYYHAPDWSKVNTGTKLKRIPAFGISNEGLEILYLKLYTPDSFWFALPDWHPAIQWACIEEEISNYYSNLIANSFSPTMFVSLNNGIPQSIEEENAIIKKIKDEATGTSNAGNVMISFSESKETENTITAIPLNDAPQQYQFLSEESGRKILVGHRVTSPLLLGINTATGFSSNADEIKTASILFESQAIKPFRQLILNGLDDLLAYNEIDINLYFDSLNPFQEIDNEVNATALSKVEELNLDEYADNDLQGWTLIDEREVDYDLEDSFDAQVEEWNKELNETNLASTGTAIPNAKSEQDREIDNVFFKTRYKYTGSKSPERDFCRKMMSADKIYRKEDIERMGKSGVNAGFGENGATNYDIFLYKGGPRCEHKWLRQTYMSDTRSVDVNNPNAKKISTNQAQSKYKYRLDNPKEVSMIPKDMPHKGFSPNNPNLPKDAR